MLAEGGLCREREGRPITACTNMKLYVTLALAFIVAPVVILLAAAVHGGAGGASRGSSTTTRRCELGGSWTTADPLPAQCEAKAWGCDKTGAQFWLTDTEDGFRGVAHGNMRVVKCKTRFAVQVIKIRRCSLICDRTV